MRIIRRVSPAVAGNLLGCNRSCSSNKSATLTQGELQQLVKLLEEDPKLLIDLVGRLDAQSRRRLIVAGGAMEWFGKESAASEVERADVDKDLLISPKDFDHSATRVPCVEECAGSGHNNRKTLPRLMKR
ncbi:hypothetical protein TcCL_NonESM13503 [Trypanosoma cruzi]|nr:hypothetical protein TcCL_NonESM13503 [Trypanosoma cruzi]